MTKPHASTTIESFMTPAPQSIGSAQPLSRARAYMREHAIRHLPVLEGGALVGMLTERDLAIAGLFENVDPKTLTVEEAMSTEVYAVQPSTPLVEVVREMAEKKYGSAVVLSKAKVVGIFTTVDACTVLASLLSERAS